MKYQKAKTVIHQHTVALDTLAKARAQQSTMQEAFDKLDAEPSRLRSNLDNLEAEVADRDRHAREEIETLKTRIQALEREHEQNRRVLSARIADTRQALGEPVPGLEQAKTSLEWAKGQTFLAESAVNKWSKEIEEARARVEEIAKLEAERAANPVKVIKHPLQKKLEQNKALPRSRIDPMGNTPQDPTPVKVKGITRRPNPIAMLAALASLPPTPPTQTVMVQNPDPVNPIRQAEESFGH